MLGLENWAMLPSYFDYIFVHLKQKARLRPELSPKFLSTLGPNPARTRPEPDPKSPARLTTLLRVVLKVPFEKASPSCPSEVPTPLPATMFLKLAYLIPNALSARVNAFFLLLQHHKIAKSKKRVFFDSNDSQKFSQMLRNAQHSTL